MAKAPIKWYGGKQMLTPFLLQFISAHHCYVEPYGGSGALLFAKEPSAVEIYNDIDQNVVNFYRVLRDDAKSARLVDLLDNTPYAREEYDECDSSYDVTDDVERARKFFVLIRQSFNGVFREGWSYSTRKNCARDFANSVVQIKQAKKRLRSVQIESRPAIDVIKQFDSKDTFMYLDPPYMRSLRDPKDRYEHEMDDQEHKPLLDLIVVAKSKIVLSGYSCDLYNSILQDWRSFDVPVACHSTPNSVSQQSVGKGKASRIETVWANPYAAEHAKFFEDIFAE